MANSMAVIPDNEIIVEGGGLVPSTQGASSGDVLTVGQNGPEWAAPGGGGSSYTAGSGVTITNDVISLNIGGGLKFQGDGGYVYVQYPLPLPKTQTAQGKFLQVTDAEYGTMSWTAINGVPDYTSADASKVLTVNSGATGVEWATPSGGGSSVTTIVAPYPSNYTASGQSAIFDFTSASSPPTLVSGRQLLQVTAMIDGFSNFGGDTGYVYINYSADYDDGSSWTPISGLFMGNVSYSPDASGTSTTVNVIIPGYLAPQIINIVVDNVELFFTNGSAPASTGNSYVGVWSI